MIYQYHRRKLVNLQSNIQKTWVVLEAYQPGTMKLIIGERLFFKCLICMIFVLNFIMKSILSPTYKSKSF
jgi:hypothetical protein